MENKHYTPSIEEFHVGFEYQSLQDERLPEKEESWETNTIKDEWEMRIFIGYYCGDHFAGLRIKYLDEKDLKEIGFIDKATIHKGLQKDSTKLFQYNNGRYFVHLEATWFSSWVVIRIDTSVSENSVQTQVVHSITINNKSALLVLMKQLNIL